MTITGDIKCGAHFFPPRVVITRSKIAKISQINTCFVLLRAEESSKLIHNSLCALYVALQHQKKNQFPTGRIGGGKECANHKS